MKSHFRAKAFYGKKPTNLVFKIISHERSATFSSKSIQLIFVFILFLKPFALFIA